MTTREQYQQIITEAHDYLHAGNPDKAHDILHLGTHQVLSGSSDPEVLAAVRRLQTIYDKPMPCQHTIGDLIVGKNNITMCGACVAEYNAIKIKEMI